MGLGWNNLPFDIPNHRAENGPADFHVRIGWLRSVANIYHAFAIHSFADELAKAANNDSVQYLLDLIGPARIVPLEYKEEDADEKQRYPLDTARLRRVVEIAAEKSGWGKTSTGKGRGMGIAAHRSFLTYVATVVEVEVDSKGQVHIPNVWTALDAGTVVSPDNGGNQQSSTCREGAYPVSAAFLRDTYKSYDESIADAAPPAHRSFRECTGDCCGRGGGPECCPSADRRKLQQKDRTNREAFVRLVRQPDQSDTKRCALRCVPLDRPRLSTPVDRRGTGIEGHSLSLCRRPVGVVGAARLARGRSEARHAGFARPFS